jgi:hypothetical protein
VAIVATGYASYALVRLAVRASHPAAVAHAAGRWRAERWLHLDIEPSLNHLAAACPVLAETAGYYYGLAHFIVTPLVLAWLWLRRPAAFGPLRSALVLATTGANVVFWTWPAAPPRFAVPGMTDILVRRRPRRRHPQPVAPPGLALPHGHHVRGARHGQPLPRRRRRPGRHRPGPACRPRPHEAGRLDLLELRKLTPDRESPGSGHHAHRDSQDQAGKSGSWGQRG